MADAKEKELEFPRWVHHEDLKDGKSQSKLVTSQEEFDALGEGWHAWAHEATTAREAEDSPKPKKSKPAEVFAPAAKS